MLSQRKINNFLFFFLSTIPFSIILGPSISLANIVIINIFILIVLTYQREFHFFKDPTIKLILFLYAYLVFNTLISQDNFIGASRNFGFVRFILLFICINYFFVKHPNVRNIFYFWIISIVALSLDSLIEFYFGQNIFGWGDINEIHGPRIVSFFKDEPIVGAYLSGFILLIFGFLLEKFKQSNFLPWLFVIFTFLVIVFSGERSNSIKIFFGLVVMFSFFDFLKIKIKFSLLIFVILSFTILLNQSSYLKHRFLNQFIFNFTSKEKFEKFISESQYISLYKSGITVFKNNPIFGVGNKNYRIETCSEEEKNIKNNYYCSTHPHQIYIELLSEHGLFGTLVILGIFFALMFRILLNILKSRNYIQIGSFCFIIFVFSPLIPSGAFFGDFNSTILWLNISIMFASCKKTNIFNYRSSIKTGR